MIRKLDDAQGYTLIELFIALFLTGIVAAAGFSFYVSMHNSAVTQEDISNMQHTARSSLQEMAKTLRMAGYKLPNGHPACEFNGDTMFVYYSGANPVDTMCYFLQETQAVQVGTPTDWIPMQLMKQVNSSTPAVFSDVIRNVTYNVIDSATVEITVECQTNKADESWGQDDGFRTFTLTERVSIRNMNL